MIVKNLKYKDVKQKSEKYFVVLDYEEHCLMNENISSLLQCQVEL